MKYASILVAGVIFAATPAMAAEAGPARPLGNPGDWVTTQDYPVPALRELQEGAVAFRLDIDKAGRVGKCTVTVGSGYDLLDDTACDLITRRAMFQPATDKRGRPVAGSYMSRVRWTIPGPGSPPQAARPLPSAARQSQFELTYLVGADDKVSDCRIVAAEGLFSNMRSAGDSPCRTAPPIGPLPDAAGNPQKRQVHVKMQVDVDPLP